ncbi:MAG: ABC transporter ATP-binding protein, partial [Butyrivibrio sp.]|nr:ABC transporter ATP-binding protein [Butyrivibrio sp.]
KISEWRAERDKEEADKKEFERQRLMKKGAVEKSNKDEVFKYHVQKVEEQDESLMDEPVITDADFVLGIRPEAIDIEPAGKINTKIYGAMPTGMESTLKLKVGEFLLTSVIFGNSIYLIGQDANIDIKGKDILLFDRRSGKLISGGTLEIM